MRVGVWIPVYGGWLRTNDHRYQPSFKTCYEVASRAEACRYDYVYVSENYLNVVYGEEFEVADAWAYSAGIAAKTAKINIVVATKPGFHTPLPLAKMAQGINHISNGRLSINIVCGWWKREFAQCDIEYLDHGGRYQRATEFTLCLKKLWTGKYSQFEGNHIALHDALVAMEEPSDGQIPIWVSGQSASAQELAAQYGDVYFIDSMPEEDLKEKIQQLRELEARHGRKAQIAMNVFVIMDETDEKARARYTNIIENRQQNLIDEFRKSMAESGATMWKGLTDEQMVDSNCGFDASLIGNSDTILKRLFKLKKCGVDILLCQFEDMLNDTVNFGETILPELTSAEENIDTIV